MSENLRNLSHRTGTHQKLFDRLGESVKSSPEETREAVERLARETLYTPSTLSSTTSFYDFLNPSSQHAAVHVCHGTACLVNGSSRKTQASYPEGQKALCVGRCFTGSALIRKEGDQVWRDYTLQDGVPVQPRMPVYNLAATPVLTGSEHSLEQLYRIALEQRDGIMLELQRSQLRGRGGAGFGFAFKCQATAEAPGGEKYIVCNADEGDPGAFSDRYLLEQQPHKVLAGMYAAAQATGASRGLLYIRWEYPEAVERVRCAIREFQQLPDDISRGFSFDIVKGAGSYVCGEETALLNSIEGQRPEVRVRPPYPATNGLWGKPTLLSNVETFANIPWILINGGQAYSEMGTRESRGTKLLSLDSLFTRPGLYEVEFGYELETLVYRQAGGFRIPVKALQVGGPLGSVLPIAVLSGLTIDFESFHNRGFALGHAGVVSIPQSFPMIDFMHHLFEYMADESCGKCTPCRLGTARGREMIESSKSGSPMDPILFEELLDLLEHGSLCALGGGLPLPVRNMLTYFEDELRHHFITAD